MTNEETKSSGFGIRITFLNALFLIFLTLKLTGTITWSWWWVTAPMWMPFAVVLIALVFAVICFGIGKAIEELTKP